MQSYHIAIDSRSLSGQKIRPDNILSSESILRDKIRGLYIFTTWHIVLFSRLQSQPILPSDPLGGFSVIPNISTSQVLLLNFQ